MRDRRVRGRRIGSLEGFQVDPADGAQPNKGKTLDRSDSLPQYGMYYEARHPGVSGLVELLDAELLTP